MDSNHKSKKYTKVLNEYAGICRINLRERKFIAIKVLINGYKYFVSLSSPDKRDYFNDQYGHNAGDQAIKAVSRAIQSCIRPDDIFIRYGGDEFVLIFQDIHYDAFTTRLYQLSECVKQTKVDDYEDLSLSITVGGIYGNSKVNDAIKKADKLMYEGKKSKRSVVVKKTSEVD